MHISIADLTKRIYKKYTQSPKEKGPEAIKIESTFIADNKAKEQFSYHNSKLSRLTMLYHNALDKILCAN